ncbi:unnamed protein product, partial [Iphiclides podalirius]
MAPSTFFESEGQGEPQRVQVTAAARGEAAAAQQRLRRPARAARALRQPRAHRPLRYHGLGGLPPLRIARCLTHRWTESN